MESDLHVDAVRQTEAALRGLADSLGPAPAALLGTPLARIGDALRLSLEIPGSIRRWADGLGRPELQGALAALIEEAATWECPRGELDPTDGPGWSFVLRRRDEAESVRAAVRRICLPKQLDPYELEEFVMLEQRLATFDVAAGARLSRSDVVQLLGTRAAMGAIWADGFEALHEGDRVEPAAVEERWPESIGREVPSDEVITRYATRGAMSRYVEGVAAVNKSFAGDLAVSIDALLLAREDVGLVARRWRKHGAAALTANPLRFAAIPPLRLAASTAPGTDSATITLALGVLSPLDAEARFQVSARELTLQVFEGQQTLQRVELGVHVVAQPSAPGRWGLAVPATTGPMRLRVVSADGHEFSEELIFDLLDIP